MRHHRRLVGNDCDQGAIWCSSQYTEGACIKLAYVEMTSIPTFLGFLLTLPAARLVDEQTRRRRAIQGLRLSSHLLNDVGMPDCDNPAADPRWVQRPDLER